ncbi:hypothetical protein LTR86_010551 [Recurvomyces mirabilis]|nr:hypothetical protein LTR86_010551 [Recurvomyces mirabilis]
MPKEIRPSTARSASTMNLPYSIQNASAQRNAAIWSAPDDEKLLHARASGLNWQPIANRHFPNKTANACRKRHERLIERRQVEDWDAQKLELLAQEYVALRKEMWEVLAARVGERWSVVEAKSTARTAQRRSSATDRGTSENNSDSGVYLGASDNEMDTGLAGTTTAQHTKSSSWHANDAHQQLNMANEHVRSRSLPQLLPLYQPPPPVSRPKRTIENGIEMTTSPEDAVFPRTTTRFSRYSPDSNGRGGISIESVLSPLDPLTAYVVQKTYGPYTSAIRGS